MSQRFLVYPALFVVVMQLVPLLRRGRCWYAAQIAQHALILLAAVGAMIFDDDPTWVVLVWVQFVAFVIAPRLCVRFRRWRWAGWLSWGQLGRLFRRYADAVEHRTDARTLLDTPMPEAVRGDVRVFQLRLLTDAGDWLGAIDLYRSVEDWGTLLSATRARLLAARAFAHTGDFERALRSLQFALMSPRMLGDLYRQYLAAREEILALAAVTPVAMDALHAAEEQSAAWRALMDWRRPGRVTFGLVLACATVWLADAVVSARVLDHPLWVWAGNMPEGVRHGECWRPVTALFLHANLLHLAMNGAALWMFGTAIERTYGRWRYLAIFLVAGTLANAVSALFANYDVSVGASGGIFGLVAAFGVAVYRLRLPMYAGVRRRLLLMLGVMLAVDLTVGGLEPQIDNFAHGGGFAAGLALAALLSPPRHQGTKNGATGFGFVSW